MIDYREDNNVDRITSFMSCLGLEYYLDANYMLPSINRNKPKNEEKPKQKTEEKFSSKNVWRQRWKEAYFLTNLVKMLKISNFALNLFLNKRDV